MQCDETARRREGVYVGFVEHHEMKWLVGPVAVCDQAETHVGEEGFDLRVIDQHLVSAHLPHQCLGVLRLFLFRQDVGG